MFLNTSNVLIVLNTQFIQPFKAKEAIYIFKDPASFQTLNPNTINKYLKLFGGIVLNYYHKALHEVLLDGSIEIDETLVFREKKKIQKNIGPISSNLFGWSE